MSGGCRISRRRSSAGRCLPVLVATRMAGRSTPAAGLQGDPGERGPKVALDVIAERLERRDVQDPAASGRISRYRLDEQPVKRPQEGGQRLARACRRQDQRVPAPADGVPSLALGRRRRARRWHRTRWPGWLGRNHRSRHPGYGLRCDIAVCGRQSAATTLAVVSADCDDRVNARRCDRQHAELPPPACYSKQHVGGGGRSTPPLSAGRPSHPLPQSARRCRRAA